MTTPKPAKSKKTKKETLTESAGTEKAKTAAAGTADKPKKAAAKKPAAKKPAAAKKTGDEKPKAPRKTAPKKKDASEPKAEVKVEKKPVVHKEKPEVKPAAEEVKKPVPEHTVHSEAKPAVKPAPVPVQQPKSAVAPAAKPASAPAVQQPKPVPAPAPAAKPAAAPVQQQPAPVAAAKPAETVPPPPAPKKPVIKVIGQPTVRELAEKMGIKINDFIKKLMGMGVYASINQRLESDLAVLVVSECGFELEVSDMYAAEELAVINDKNEKPENLKPRPPVVTIMGHVDHGKTSLLDAVRSSNVCAGESGAITQHIGAYRVCTSKGDIVFLDTPGHAAFTAMRSRGAHVTDIVILVVSATDGIMPQTVEAMDHAKAAGVPIIVAVNKIDLPGANPAKIRQDLSSYGLMPEEWQGKTIFVDISAKKRLNIDKLLEMVAVQAEVLDLKANPNKRGSGHVLEAERDPRRGIVATILVKTGTVKVGDCFVAGASYGRVRALIDDKGARLKEVLPSYPAEVLGTNGEPPHVGDLFYVVEDEREARQIAETRRLAIREESLAHQKHVTLLGLRSQLQKNQQKILQVILKGDVQGSLQAIRDSLERIGNDDVEIKIIHSAMGNVNDSDILLAKASDAIILAFHVDVENTAEAEADREGIEIRKYSIIFELIEDVRAAMEGLLEPEVVEVPTAKVEVRQAFNLSSGLIAGSFVLEGKVVRSSEVRVYRGKDVLLKGKISGLKRFKEDVREVEKGFECGVLIDGYKDIKAGDIIETFIKENRIRRIEKHD